MRRFYFLLLILVTSACATTNVVSDASESDTISAVSMSCKKPYELTQDCSIWWGATRTLVIEGYEVKVAGSEHGDVILVMDAHLLGRSALEGLTWNIGPDYHSEASNNSFEAVRKVLADNERTILAVKALKSFGNIDGYVIELDSDGYELLKPYTQK